MSSKRSPLKTHKDFIYALLWIIETFMNKYQTTRHKLYLELRLIPFWKSVVVCATKITGLLQSENARCVTNYTGSPRVWWRHLSCQMSECVIDCSVLHRNKDASWCVWIEFESRVNDTGHQLPLKVKNRISFFFFVLKEHITRLGIQ